MSAAQSASESVLGIIAGGGRLPSQLVETCRAQSRPCFVITFDDNTNHDAIKDTPHAIVRLGAVGEALEHMKRASVRDVVLAGSVKRPSLSSLRPDLAGTRLLARIGTAFFGGDDAVLRTVVKFLEEEGFRVVGSNDVLSALLAGQGVLGNIQPDSRSNADIALGLQAAKELGRLDIGQAVIVENGHVLGLEAAEGTDELIGRCAKLRKEKSGGVLVKARKPGQEMRADLPAIGPDTVEKMHEAGFAGIAVEAGGSLILDKERVISKADALGLFIVGITHE